METRRGLVSQPPRGAPLRGYPADSSVRDITTVRRLLESRQSISRRIRILVGLAQAVSAEQEDLGVFDQAVGDCSGNRCVVEDVAPVRKRRVRCNERTALAAVTRGDYLVKEVRRLLIERKIPEFVTDEERRFGIDLQLANERVIDLRNRLLSMSMAVVNKTR